MKILVFDTEIHTDDIYDLISKYLDINFEKTSIKEFFYEYYEKYQNELLIIDITNEIGEKILQDIIKIKPKQKILTLSKNIFYNSNFTCKECTNNFNKRLLLKPLEITQLVNYIQNFDKILCKYSSFSNDILDILDEVLKQFMHYKYNKQEKLIEKKSSISNIKELISITEILNNHNIKYSIKNEDFKLFF